MVVEEERGCPSLLSCGHAVALTDQPRLRYPATCVSGAPYTSAASQPHHAYHTSPGHDHTSFTKLCCLNHLPTTTCHLATPPQAQRARRTSTHSHSLGMAGNHSTTTPSTADLCELYYLHYHLHYHLHHLIHHSLHLQTALSLPPHSLCDCCKVSPIAGFFSPLWTIVFCVGV